MGRRPLAGWRSGMTALTAAAPGPGLSGAATGRAPHIVVAGGGLAGVAAAIALCDGGARVTLLEARPRLGGATCSFSRGGLTVDNGQHIFLRCCTAYRGLLDRLGMTANTVLQKRFDVRVLTPSGAARLRRRALPAPFHLASALATYPLLSRTGAGRCGACRARLSPSGPGRPAHRQAAARRLARRPRPGAAGTARALGPVRRLGAEHRRATTPRSRSPPW